MAMPKVKRTFVLEPLVADDGSIVQQRARAEQTVLDLLGSLWAVGGIVRIVSDRVHEGDLPPAEEGGAREPLATTVGLVIEYQVNTPLNKSSITQAMLNAAFEDDEPAPAPLAAAVSQAAPLVDDDGEDDDEDAGDGED